MSSIIQILTAILCILIGFDMKQNVFFIDDAKHVAREISITHKDGTRECIVIGTESEEEDVSSKVDEQIYCYVPDDKFWSFSDEALRQFIEEYIE